MAAACEEIVDDPANAFRYTSRGNLVAVVTNGTAVLGLGNIGPLASKPVMEGKGVLFKKFAGIDVFDIEIAENDLDKLVDIIAALEPTFGGINLEDIKAPECFYVERKLRERMKIPVFHDDQHGTAIVVGAAMLNGLKVVGKSLQEVKLVSSARARGAGLPEPAGQARSAAREHLGDRHRRGVVLRGPHRADGRGQGRVRAEDRLRTLARGDRRAPTSSWACRRRRAQGRHGGRDGGEAADLRAGQPGPGDHAGQVAAGARRRGDRHRPQRLSEPGQQRPVLPVTSSAARSTAVRPPSINDEMEIAVHAIADLAQAEEPSEVVAAAYAGRRRDLRSPGLPDP